MSFDEKLSFSLGVVVFAVGVGGGGAAAVEAAGVFPLINWLMMSIISCWMKKS